MSNFSMRSMIRVLLIVVVLSYRLMSDPLIAKAKEGLISTTNINLQDTGEDDVSIPMNIEKAFNKAKSAVSFVFVKNCTYAAGS